MSVVLPSQKSAGYRFKSRDCPWEKGKIEDCPAFLEPKHAKDFKCKYVKECIEDIRKIVGEASGLI